MKQKIFEILSIVLEVPLETINEHSSPDTIPTWDSIRHMNLVMALEEAFHIQFTSENIIEMMNVELILEIIKEGTGQSAD